MQKKNIPTTQSAAPFVDSVQEPTKPSEVGGVTPEQPLWVDPSLKSTSPLASSTSVPGISISGGLESNQQPIVKNQNTPKYDLSKLYDFNAPRIFYLSPLC